MKEQSSFLTPNSPLFNIPELDCQRGIAMTGGTASGYFTVLSMFCKDAENRLSLIKNVPGTDALPLFVTHVHALKSVCASIGSANVSALAAELEAAGRADNLTLIQEKFPFFADRLTELIENIKAAMNTETPETQSASQSSFFDVCGSLLKNFNAALDSQKASDINRILKEIKEASGQQPLDPSVKEALEQISDEVMMAEYDNAKEIVEKLINV